MAVDIKEKAATEPAVKVSPLPDLQPSDRPQLVIEVGLIPLPAEFKKWLYRKFGGPAKRGIRPA